MPGRITSHDGESDDLGRCTNCRSGGPVVQIDLGGLVFRLCRGCSNDLRDHLVAFAGKGEREENVEDAAIDLLGVLDALTVPAHVQAKSKVFRRQLKRTVP